MNYQLSLVLAIGLLCLFTISSSSDAQSPPQHLKFESGKKYSAHFSKAKNTWSVEQGDTGVAWATLDASQNATGWNVLTVVSKKEYADPVQAYGLGFIEVMNGEGLSGRHIRPLRFP